MSEHELRVQRSLQKLTVPDWYKNSQIPAQGFLLKKTRESRWTGTGSKTTSLSSLGSGTQSPLILSPTPSSQPFVRWSTSKLNSTASSPCQSTRSSFNQGRQPNGTISPSSARSSFSYRQPYMGWRSQERLNRPRTTAERLASSLLNQQANLQQESPEIQTSIKEVTSAIVHYVSGLKPTVDGVDFDSHSRRSSSVSPRGSQKLCWLESSFVGTKPLDSPETPVTCSESPVPPPSLRLELQNHSNNGPERDWEASETLILTCPPIRLPTKETSKRARLIAFNNLQSQLSERGVSLKKQYPDLYQKLDSYCEDLAIKVEPETIFPHSVTTHKSFVCIVMLESDQEKVKLAEKSGGSRVRTVDCLLSCETTTTQ